MLPPWEQCALVRKEINGHNTPPSAAGTKIPSPLPCEAALTPACRAAHPPCCEAAQVRRPVSCLYKSELCLLSHFAGTNKSLQSSECQILVLLPCCLCARRALQTTGWWEQPVSVLHWSRSASQTPWGNLEEGAWQILINYKAYSHLVPRSGKGRELLFCIYSQADQVIGSPSTQDRFPTTEVDPAGILLAQQNSNYFHLTPTDRAVIPSQNKGQESSSSHIIQF